MILFPDQEIVLEEARQKLRELHKAFHYNPVTGILSRTGGITQAGYISEAGYRRVKFNGKSYMAHRLAWLIMTGGWPYGEIDHINHKRSDNRWINLRDVPREENQRNSSRRRDNNSGVVGVNWKSKNKKWVAQIYYGKVIHLGIFTKKSDAIAARKAAEIKYGFHPNHGSVL